MILANTITSGNLFCFHGIFLNLFIGIFEGLLLLIFFQARRHHIIFRMIAANYTSWLFGFFLFPCAYYLTRYIDLFTVKFFVLIGFLAFLIATIIIEWPFISGAFKEKAKPVLAALLASVIVQCISYAMLFPLYFVIGRYPLLFTVHIERQLDFVQQKNVGVYYFAAKDGFVYRLDLDTMKSELVSDAVRYKSRFDQLYTVRKKGGEKWDLYAYQGLERDDASYHESILIAKGISDQSCGRLRDYAGVVPTHVTDLRTEPKSSIDVNCFGFVGRGLTVTKNAGGFICTALDTPFITWDSRDATILPGDQIVFELERQICILDCKTRKIGVLVEGSSPLTCIDPKAKE